MAAVLVLLAVLALESGVLIWLFAAFLRNLEIRPSDLGVSPLLLAANKARRRKNTPTKRAKAWLDGKMPGG